MHKSVVIIGAGASGIAAATRLLERGFTNLTVLEAEPRIGGRVNTVRCGDGYLDLGAQWCHGETNNVVYEMAKDLDVLARPDGSVLAGMNFVQSDGTAMSSEANEKLSQLFSLVELDDDEKLNATGSHGSVVIRKFDAVLKTEQLADELTDLNVDPNILRQFSGNLEGFVRLVTASDSWFDSSCRGFGQREACAGENLLDWKGKGYRTIFDVLLRKITTNLESLPLQPNIHLNKPVRQIRWSTTKRAIVECEDGTQFEADHVICTVSVGVLQSKGSTLFSPRLPTVKRNAIESMKLGTVNKIYIKFEQPFWEPDWCGFIPIWGQRESDALAKNPAEEWIRCLFQYTTVRYHPNILCGWPTGPQARHVETLPEDDVTRIIVKWLGRFLKSRIITKPVQIIRSRWSSEPNFLGSYSYESVRSDELHSSRGDLGAPVLNASGVPVLQFAGEATELHHFASVHGAIETGWREANRLVELYK